MTNNVILRFFTNIRVFNFVLNNSFVYLLSIQLFLALFFKLFCGILITINEFEAKNYVKTNCKRIGR